MGLSGPYHDRGPPISDRIRISVICPKPEARILEAFLAGVDNQWYPKQPEKEDYLVPYPGFERTYRLPLQVPKQTDTHWFTLPEIDPSRDQRSGSRELSQNIREAIRAAASRDRSIMLILTPTRWDRWRRFETDNEVFDVHDFIKAYAVQRGIATQFLKQEKLNTTDKCRFWWWLSLALYTN